MQWDDETFTELDESESNQTDNYEDESVDESQDDSYESEQAGEDSLALTEQEESLLGTAMIRLDQARLYEMLVKHDLFEGVSANQIALKAVQREIKTFIMDRLEILLGLKSEKSVKTQSQFNDIEIQALKDLAFAATKGASRQQRETPKPVSNQPAREGLKPLALKSSNSLKSLNNQKNSSPKAAQSTPNNQKQNTTKQVTTKKRRSNNDFLPLEKNISEMSSEELLERARMSSDIYKGRTAVNPQALPPPSFEQQMMQYSTILSDNGIGSTLMKKLGGNGVYDAGDGE